MRICQPSELKEFFSEEQELFLQDRLKKAFTGKVRPGFYTLSWEEVGRVGVAYFVGFLVEVPSVEEPNPFICECYCASIEEMTRTQFDEKIEKLSEEAEKNPNRILAKVTYKQKHAEIEQKRKMIDRMQRGSRKN